MLVGHHCEVEGCEAVRYCVNHTGILVGTAVRHSDTPLCVNSLHCVVISRTHTCESLLFKIRNKCIAIAFTGDWPTVTGQTMHSALILLLSYMTWSARSPASAGDDAVS